MCSTSSKYISFFLSQLFSYIRSIKKGGYTNFHELLFYAPGVNDIYLHKARNRDPAYSFWADISNDSDIFLEILDHTFCPSGLFTAQKYNFFISIKPMTSPFTSGIAATYSFHVYSFRSVLNTKFVSQMHVIHDFWKVICKCVEYIAFQYSLKTQTSASFDTFWSVIESRAAIFVESNSPTGYLQRQSPSNLLFNASL